MNVRSGRQPKVDNNNNLPNKILPRNKKTRDKTHVLSKCFWCIQPLPRVVSQLICDRVSHLEKGEKRFTMRRKNEQSSTFLRSHYTTLATLLRVACVFELLIPSEWLPWIHSRALQSTVVDSVYTLGHVHEAAAIRQFIVPHSFAAAYEGGSIHLPPLFLALFQPILKYSEPQQRIIVGLCLIVVDILIAWSLERLGRFLVQQRKTEWEDERQDQVPEAIQPKLTHIFQVKKENNAMISSASIPFIMAQLYYLSPVTLLTSNVFVCFQNIPVLFVLAALFNAFQGSLIWGALGVALASYINIHHAIFLFPSVLLIRERRKSISVFVFCFVVSAAALQALSLYLVGTDSYLFVVSLTHGWTFQIQGIEPSLSTMWYLGMEMFDRFAVYFTILIGGAPYLLMLPLLIRLHRYPEALVR